MQIQYHSLKKKKKNYIFRCITCVIQYIEYIFIQGFFAVLFEDGASVTQSSWIFSEKDEESENYGLTMSYWTSTKSQLRQLQPPNPNWKKYRVVKFLSKRLGDI